MFDYQENDGAYPSPSSSSSSSTWTAPASPSSSSSSSSPVTPTKRKQAVLHFDVTSRLQKGKGKAVDRGSDDILESPTIKRARTIQRNLSRPSIRSPLQRCASDPSPMATSPSDPDDDSTDSSSQNESGIWKFFNKKVYTRSDGYEYRLCYVQ